IATDSSSGTLPSSSRLTIDSSSSIAFSKESFLTSAWLVSAMLVFRMIATQGQALIEMLPFSRAGFDPSSPHQRRHMGGDRLRKSFNVVATLDHRDDTAAAISVGAIHELGRDPGEIGLDQVEVRQRIARMGVEAGRDQQQIRLEAVEPRQDHAGHGLAELVAAVARPQRRVDDIV